MRINVGYRSNLQKQQLAFLDTLSPTRKAEVQRGLDIAQNGELNDLLRALDSDPDDSAIRILLDESMKNAVMHEVAGKGYRKQLTTPSTRNPDKGKYLLAPDKPTNYGSKEQAALELLALRKELDYLNGSKVVPIDTANPLYQRIAKHNAEAIRSASIKATAEGGIDQIRAKHPDLPPQTAENSVIATNNQMYDNLVGNERGEQPTTSLDKNNIRAGLPVEHKLSFKGNEILGREPDNRMLGSTIKNSVLRAEPSEQRQKVLLMGNLAAGETAFEENFNQTVRDYMSEQQWKYKPGIDVMPDY